MVEVKSRTEGIIRSAMESNMFSIAIAGAWLPDLPLVYVNKQFENITGYHADEVVGRNCRFLQGPDTSAEAVAEISHAIANRKPVATNLLNYRKDGSSFWNRFQMSPLFGKSGELDGYMGIQVDMTLDAINASNQAKRLKLETLGKIAGSIAHDLGNVLQPISLLSEELKEICLNLPPEYRTQAENCLSIILDRTSVGGSITRRVLSYSVPNQKHTVTENFLEVFSDACEFASGSLSKKISVTTRVEDGFDKNLIVTLEVNSLNQAFLNLFDNAALAMGGSGTLALSVQEDHTLKRPEHTTAPRMVRIDITDVGNGIPEQELDRIFDPYFTTRPDGQGSGLGLFAVKRLVADWGGKISVRSSVNEGSTFSLFIPARSGETSNV